MLLFTFSIDNERANYRIISSISIDDAIRYQNHLLASGIDVIDKVDGNFNLALNRIEGNGNILFGEGFAKNEKYIKRFIKECLTLKSGSYEKHKILD